MKRFTADSCSPRNSRLPQFNSSDNLCLSLRGALLLLAENYKGDRNQRVLIQYSEGREAFSTQTAILRSIISLVKRLKGKRQSFQGLPFLFPAFQAVSKAKLKEPIPAGVSKPQPSCTITTWTVAQISQAKTLIHRKYPNTKVSPTQRTVSL